MIIGSHVKMCAPNYILGSVQEAVSYGANALMIYTGAPQNTLRKPISIMKVEEAKKVLEEHSIPLENVIVHAPYIINLGNVVNPSTFELGVSFLAQEIVRVEEIGASFLVLHPGSYTTATKEEGINKVIEGLNLVLKPTQKVTVLLETMAGKGSEIGVNFSDLAYIMEKVALKDKLGICLDTCHIHDVGYDVSSFDAILDEFDATIGLSKLKVMHINDSKNSMGAHKDRHANLGEGEIGFETLNQIVHNQRVEKVIKILETPWVNDHPPYKEEIEMLKNGKYNPNALDAYK